MGKNPIYFCRGTREDPHCPYVASVPEQAFEGVEQREPVPFLQTYDFPGLAVDFARVWIDRPLLIRRDDLEAVDCQS